MLLYRVAPILTNADEGEPGSARFAHPDQGAGRWDNPDLYAAFYAASSPEGAIGETFAHLSRWTADMLVMPALPTSRRTLVTYDLDEEQHPLLDLDDAKALLDRGLRPTEVVVRKRPHTQAIARSVYLEKRWSGLSWWSMHRPQWTLHCLFGTDHLTVVDTEEIAGHSSMRSAALRLAKEVDSAFAGR